MTAKAARREAAGGDVRDRLASLLGAGAAAGTITVVGMPAPLGPPEALLGVAPDQTALLWDPEGGPSVAGIGAAHEIALEGEGRIDDLRAEAASLWRRLSVSGGGAPAPRLYGGLSFAVGGAAEAPWRAFGDGRFVLPRWRYLRSAGRAFLTVAARGEELASAAARDRLLDEHHAILAALHRGDDGAVDAPPLPARVEQLHFEAWRQLVDGARAEIAAGRSAKIVVARRAEVSADEPIDPAAVLARLAAHPGCTRFAFRAGRSCFVGATPERLISRAGDRVLTEALAGSTRSDDGAGLLASAKDGAEHALVVRAIAERLAPLCRELMVAEAPRVRALRHLLHLHTPIAGRLAEPLHVLALVAALHPTPAVGGVPTLGALRWIAAHEPARRGWYAGPIGWFDAEGDGEFAVALRSGLIEGRRALVYAGGGILEASRAEAEYAETGWKQRTLLDALGIAP